MLRVIVVTSDNNKVDYEFDGALSPNRWTERPTTKGIVAFDLPSHEGKVDNCYVNYVLFRDGTSWFGGTPDM
ncbi:MAG: hypothetical protein ABI431_04680 [Candidatus Tumulicola sp.]